MPFRVLPTGVIECDTIDEAIGLQKRLAKAQPAPEANGAIHRAIDEFRQPEDYRPRDTVSNRAKVLEQIKDWASVEQIRRLTDLEVKKIRGVLHAPVLKERIQTRREGGVKEYKLTEG